jgi:hypothetical protein
MYQMTSNIATYLPVELVRAYPHAKFILVEREPDSWLESLKRSTGPLVQGLRSFPIPFLSWFDTYAYEVYPHLESPWRASHMLMSR